MTRSGSSSRYSRVLVRAARSSPEFGRSPVLGPSGHQQPPDQFVNQSFYGPQDPLIVRNKKGWPPIGPDFLESRLLRLVAPEPTAQLIFRVGRRKYQAISPVRWVFLAHD